MQRFISQLLLEERPDVHRMMACNSGPSEPGAADWFESLVVSDVMHVGFRVLRSSWCSVNGHSRLSSLF